MGKLGEKERIPWSTAGSWIEFYLADTIQWERTTYINTHIDAIYTRFYISQSQYAGNSQT